MTTDLDLSPEAVERLAKAISESRMSSDPLIAADTLRLLDEIERLRADRTQGAKDYYDLMERYDRQHVEIAKLKAALAEQDVFKKALEREKADHRAYIAKSGGKIRAALAERDAAWQAGAEAMREEVAEWVVVYGVRDPLDIAHDIRALPIPDKEGA